MRYNVIWIWLGEAQGVVLGADGGEGEEEGGDPRGGHGGPDPGVHRPGPHRGQAPAVGRGGQLNCQPASFQGSVMARARTKTHTRRVQTDV